MTLLQEMLIILCTTFLFPAPQQVNEGTDASLELFYTVKTLKKDPCLSCRKKDLLQKKNILKFEETCLSL